MIETETWGYRPRSRAKRCYELVLRALTDGRMPEGTVAIFGLWSEFLVPHVWAMLPDGRIWEPVSASIGEASEQIAKYSLTEYTFAKTRFAPMEAIHCLLRFGCYEDYAVALSRLPSCETREILGGAWSTTEKGAR